MASVVVPMLVSSALTSAGATAATVMVATAITGAMGAYFDSAVLYPTLFPTDKPDTPRAERMSELDLQSVSEGSSVKICYGPDVRCRGTVIWMSEIREIETREQGPAYVGKGQHTKHAGYSTYTYRVDVAVAVSGRCQDTIDRVLGDNKLLYAGFDEGDGQNVRKEVSTQISHWWFVDYGAGSVGPHHVYESPVDGPDLTQFLDGQPIVVSGFTDPNNDSPGDDGGKVSFTRRLTDGRTEMWVSYGWFSVLGPGSIEAAGDQITITQDDPGIGDIEVGGVTVYDGTEDQGPDETIEAEEGAGNVPGFRGTAYVVIADLLLDTFGRRLPQFSFYLSADESITVGEVIEDVLVRAGLDPSEIDASTCTGLVRGLVVSGPREALGQLRPLMLAYDLVARETDGVLEYLPRSSLPEVVVDPDDLAAGSKSDSESRVPLVIRDSPEFSIPTEVAVTYYDPEHDQQLGTALVRALGGSFGGRGNSMALSLPLVFSPDEATQIAARILWVSRSIRQVAILSLPPSYNHIIEGDILSVTLFGRALKIMTARVDHGLNGVIEIEGSVLDSDVLSQVQVSGQSGAGGSAIKPRWFAGVLAWSIIDIGPFRAADVEKPGVYVAMCAPGGNWRGGVLYASNWLYTHSSADYKAALAVQTQAYMGYAETVLAAGPVGYWDRENTVDVDMWNGAANLESKTEDQVLSGANWAVLGDEVIAFTTVTIIGTYRVRLSGLLRGLVATEHQIGTHVAGERFVVMSGPGINFLPLGLSDVYKTRYYKALTSGQTLEAEEERDIYMWASTVRPWPPVHASVEVDAVTGDITVRWTPRVRIPFTVLSEMDWPAPTYEWYWLYIYPTHEAVQPVRAITIQSQSLSQTLWESSHVDADGNRYVVYTAAQQTADGFTPGSPDTKAELYDYSYTPGRLGKSRPLEISLP